MAPQRSQHVRQAPDSIADAPREELPDACKWCADALADAPKARDSRMVDQAWARTAEVASAFSLGSVRTSARCARQLGAHVSTQSQPGPKRVHPLLLHPPLPAPKKSRRLPRM